MWSDPCENKHFKGRLLPLAATEVVTVEIPDLIYTVPLLQIAQRASTLQDISLNLTMSALENAMISTAI